MQRHLLATGAGRVRRKSRQDKVAAEQLVDHGHHVGMLHDLLEHLALIDQVEYALVRPFGFEKGNSPLTFEIIEAVQVAADTPQELRGNKIWHDAYAALFDFTDNLIDIVSHRLTRFAQLGSPERSVNLATGRG